MAVIPGTTILNTGGTAANNPATTPILTVPTGGGMNISGFAFTNPTATPVTVSIYRDVISSTGLVLTVSVAALAGMSGGPAVQTSLLSLTLSGGETIYAVATPPTGMVNVEIDGLVIPSGNVAALTVQQLLQANILMMNEAFGVDIPDAQTLNNGYAF